MQYVFGGVIIGLISSHFAGQCSGTMPQPPGSALHLTIPSRRAESPGGVALGCWLPQDFAFPFILFLSTKNKGTFCSPFAYSKTSCSAMIWVMASWSIDRAPRSKLLVFGTKFSIGFGTYSTKRSGCARSKGDRNRHWHTLLQQPGQSSKLPRPNAVVVPLLPLPFLTAPRTGRCLLYLRLYTLLHVRTRSIYTHCLWMER